MSDVSRCRSCGGHIRWARTVNGRTMPLDLQPHPEGNVRLIDGRAHVNDREHVRDPDDEYYRTHFETCPNYVKKGK